MFSQIFNPMGMPIVPEMSTVMDPGAKPAPAAGGGFFDKIGAFLKSDEGKAALLRSGAATLQGGLGAGIEAGANYVDKRHATAAAGKQQGFENGLATQKQTLAERVAQQNDDLGWGKIAEGLRNLGETTRHNKAGESIDMRGQNVAMRGQDVTRANNTDDNATSRANNAASVGASIYGTNVGAATEGQKIAAGIGSKNSAFTQTQTETPAVPAQSNWFSPDTPAVPKTITTTRVPMGAAGMGPATPPAEAIAALKTNPNLAGQFEAKYGAGSASQFLGGR